MKKLIAILAMLLLLVGCGTPTIARSNRMKAVGSQPEYFMMFYVDTETGIMYVKTSNGGVCVMLDRDGKPLIYEGD